MTIGVDRRAFTRESPANDETFVRIIDRRVERMIRARLLNISVGGALIESYLRIAPGRALRVGLENAPDSGWMDAEVVRLGRTQEVGIRFQSPCRPEFLLAAGQGIDAWRLTDRDEPTRLVSEAKPIPEEADDVDRIRVARRNPLD
jgi:hypothetical protein